MYQESQNLLDLVVPSTTADTNIHTFMEFKDWINFGFNPKTELNPPSYISKKSEVRSMKVKKGRSFGLEDQDRSMNKITTSLTKRFSIAYNDDDLNQIEERGEALEQSFMPESRGHSMVRKQSFGGELGFDLRENSVRRSHSAQSSVSVNGFEQINQFELIKLLGRGAFADVYLAVDVQSQTKQQYAVKILCSKKIKKKLHMRKNSMMLQGPPSPPPDLQQQTQLQPSLISEAKSKSKKGPKSKPTLADLLVRNEVAILKKMNHKYITKLYDVIIDNEKQKVYLVLEYCSGGFIGEHKDKDLEWQTKREDKKTPYLKLLQSQCKRYAKQLALALDYIHNIAKIAHRDIKPENILLSEFDEVKISDFGLGTHKLKGKKYAGTPLYMPPEAQPNQEEKGNLESEQTEGDAKAGDIWALGVTILVLLSGRHPQYTSNKIDVPHQLGKIKREISEPCKDFIEKCLESDVSKRIKAEQLMSHRWLGGEVTKHQDKMQAIVVTRVEEEEVISMRKDPRETLIKKEIKLSNKNEPERQIFSHFGDDIRQSNTVPLAPTSFKIMIDE